MHLEHLEPRRRAVTDDAVMDAGRPAERSSQQLLEAFGRRLDEYAATLPAQEQMLLYTVLHRAMTPLDRLRVSGTDSLLSPEERQFLAELDQDGGG